MPQGYLPVYDFAEAAPAKGKKRGAPGRDSAEPGGKRRKLSSGGDYSDGETSDDDDDNADDHSDAPLVLSDQTDTEKLLGHPLFCDDLVEHV